MGHNETIKTAKGGLHIVVIHHSLRSTVCKGCIHLITVAVLPTVRFAAVNNARIAVIQPQQLMIML